MKNQRIVNYWRLGYLSIWGWVSREESIRINKEVDPNNGISVKKALKDVLLPYLEHSPTWPEIRDTLRDNLKYFLTKRHLSREILEDVFMAGEPPFVLPDDPFDYYRWAWEVLFPGEDYHLENLKEYIENNEEDGR